MDGRTDGTVHKRRPHKGGGQVRVILPDELLECDSDKGEIVKKLN